MSVDSYLTFCGESKETEKMTTTWGKEPGHSTYIITFNFPEFSGKRLISRDIKSSATHTIYTNVAGLSVTQYRNSRFN